MGGGDLNSKKSWHPNTMKNQERVWKAEQAAAQEKKRIKELQREHAEERDRAELNSMIKQNATSGSGSGDNRLHWMYDKPDRKAQQEDYLLGKSIEKNYDNVEKQEPDVIPAVARRVVGSSMLSTAGDSQVDLARKLREDPLLLVKERERAARAALLNNPLQRRRLTELLRKEQEQKSNHKCKKTKKKDKNLDKQLAAKLNALSSEKGLNLATLLASDSSDSSSSEEEKSKKKKHKRDKIKKQKKKSKKKKHSSTDDSSSNEETRKRESKDASHKVNNDKNRDTIKRKSKDESSESERKYKKSRYSSDKADDRSRKSNVTVSSKYREDNQRRQLSHRSEENTKRDKTDDSHGRNRGAGLSESERAAALAAMAAAGLERERQRGRRVAQQRAAAHAEPAPRAAAPREARMLPDSLETRIHSNRHYIQRSHRHMDEHFARR